MKMSIIVITYMMLIFLTETFSSPDFAYIDGPDIHWGYNCPGNDLYQVNTRSIHCEAQCMRTPQCTHVVWSKKNGTCYLKKGVFSKKNLIPTNDTEIRCSDTPYSGDKGDPPKQFNLSATYRWDCQIPQCSGYVNILRSDKRVNLCDRGGYSPSEIVTPMKFLGFTSLMNQSKFMCNNQQPWSANDTLAYGFGSLRLVKAEDIDTCCICYRLNFMDNLLKEKTMFIQIIDHGPYFPGNPDRIDLFLPGADNFYQICKNQWHSYKSNYNYPIQGTSREECVKFPEGLRNGCLFKFDWLKNISNPNVTATKVQCPKELIDKSGCYQGEISSSLL